MRPVYVFLLLVLVLSACSPKPTAKCADGFFSEIAPGEGCFPYHFENNCRGGDGPALTTWHWMFEIQLPNGDRIFLGGPQAAIPPGEVQDGFLPVASYPGVREYTDDGRVSQSWQNQTYTKSSSLNVKLCPNDPALPTGTITATTTYYFANNCSGVEGTRGNTVWHWTYQMVRGANPGDPIQPTVELIIPVGESVSGTLPTGIYLVRDWTDDGSVNSPNALRIGSANNVDLCPDRPDLPGRPTPAP